jgi:hypothetical protein
MTTTPSSSSRYDEWYADSSPPSISLTERSFQVPSSTVHEHGIHDSAGLLEGAQTDVSPTLTYAEASAMAQDRLASMYQVPRHHVRRLLHLSFTWIQPSYQIFDIGQLLYACSKAASFDDLPPVTSVIFTHADRFLGPLEKRGFEEQKWSKCIRERCGFVLGKLLSGPPSYDAVEAFMQQAACDVGAGRPHQTWIHSGISIRMACDLGLFSPDPPLDFYSENVDVKRLKRLFWALYSFDKAISVYLGRCPSITAVPNHFRHHNETVSTSTTGIAWTIPPPQPMDHSGEYHWEISASKETTFDTICNRALQTLTQKLNKVLQHLYCPSDELGRMHGRLLDAEEVGLRQENTQFYDITVKRIEHELRDWWTFVPPQLKFRSSHLAARQGLPVNIINLK